jgi:acetolactate synthase-1/2/3 large subunit
MQKAGAAERTEGERIQEQSAAHLLVRCLENEGVRYIFGLPGEEILDVLDALADSTQIKFIVTRHEQGAAFMADVYGRLSTYPGVCMATLGPGATNLITGIADAFLDRAPLVAITGQAGLERVYKESHQYIDVVQMLRPITKWNARIERPEAIPEMVRKAFRLARLEKPGATHLELPEDVSAMRLPAELAPMPVRRTSYPRAGDRPLERAAQLINEARSPLVLAGNGVVRRQAAGWGAADALSHFVHTVNIPVTHTFMGKGALDYRDPLALPAVGLQRPGADLASLPELDRADLVITVGYDLVEWAPVLWNPRRDKTIVHIDSTPAEIDGYYIPAIEVVGEIGESLHELAGMCRRNTASSGAGGDHDSDSHQSYHSYLKELQGYASDPAMPMKPQRLVWEIRQALGDDDILISDVGAHKVWLSRFYPASRPNTVIIANGFASMGIAVPGGVAAKLAMPERKVVAVSGDGAFLMNAQELETAKRVGAAFVNVVWTDKRYGLIELNQMRRFGRAYGVEFDNPDLVQLATAFGLPAWRVESADDFLPLLKRALDMDLPSLIEVPVDPVENQNLASRPGE